MRPTARFLIRRIANQMCYALTRVSNRSTKNTENRVPELMNGFVVERFIAARLRGADEENKQRGVIHVKIDKISCFTITRSHKK